MQIIEFSFGIKMTRVKIPSGHPDLPLVILHHRERKLSMDPHLIPPGVSHPDKWENVKITVLETNISKARLRYQPMMPEEDLSLCDP